MEFLPDLEADALRVARAALAEDGNRDLTTLVVLAAPVSGSAVIELRARCVVAGLVYAGAVARLAGCEIRWQAEEGSTAPAGVLGRLEGDLGAILRAERPMLNLLQRGSGIAGATRQYVDRVADTPCRILHTRKTAPGLRLFDVAAVVAGGGAVHRLDLASTVMIKDNHWRALAREGRSLPDVVTEARRLGALEIQVEVETEQQVRDACSAGADRLLVDNQTPATVGAWTALARRLRSGVRIEATGGITLANVRDFALAGADFVSIGALTHSVAAADIAVELP